ncbi:MAG: 2-oxoacid:acceptor oxidoreductase family protein [Candidatus Omnitrophota bacterium]
MTEKVICAGFGGQGIMVMGKFLANLGLATGRFVTYLPAYGAEVRGGAAHCAVIISDEEIYSPFVEQADTAIMMNGPSLARFAARVRPKGMILLNASLSAPPRRRGNPGVLPLPFSDIAADLGNIKCANTVALGAYLAIKNIAAAAAVDKVLDKMLSGLSREIIEVNRKAIERGKSETARRDTA